MTIKERQNPDIITPSEKAKNRQQEPEWTFQ